MSRPIPSRAIAQVTLSTSSRQGSPARTASHACSRPASPAGSRRAAAGGTRDGRGQPRPGPDTSRRRRRSSIRLGSEWPLSQNTADFVSDRQRGDEEQRRERSSRRLPVRRGPMFQQPLLRFRFRLLRSSRRRKRRRRAARPGNTRGIMKGTRLSPSRFGRSVRCAVATRRFQYCYRFCRGRKIRNRSMPCSSGIRTATITIKSGPPMP